MREGEPCRLKILHVVLSMAVGGAEKMVYDMVRHPAFADGEPVVCCLDDTGEFGENLRQQGYRVFTKGRRGGLDLTVVAWLRRLMVQEKITLVHAHQYTPLFYAVPAALLTGGVKVVYTEHGRLYPDRRSWKRFLFNPLLALGVDHLVSISQSTALAMAAVDNLPLHRIRVIHNGVELPRVAAGLDPVAKRKELGLDQGCRVLGTAARLEEIKNIPMMLRALKLVLGEVPDACLLVAGQGSQMDRLKLLAEELGVAQRVKFLGLRFDLPELYRLFDVFLLTSFTEGISVTLLEAMASGVPAVVSNVGGNSEVVTHEETGFLVQLQDDERLAETIVDLLTQQDQAAAVASRGREKVVGSFSLDGCMAKYRELYAQ